MLRRFFPLGKPPIFLRTVGSTDFGLSHAAFDMRVMRISHYTEN